MSEDAALKRFTESFLRAHFEPVQPQTATSGKVHLEVWRSPQKRRTLGVEMGHDGLINVWVKAMNVPRVLPPSIAVVKKRWTGSGWKDEAGKGANSNLFGYEEFHTHPLTRLAVTSVDDARSLLEALLP